MFDNPDNFLHTKSPNIPINNLGTPITKHTSKSWNGSTRRISPKFKNHSGSPNFLTSKRFKLYDAINNCKSAGIIPYVVRDGIVYFLFQQIKYPTRKNEYGWNDFGGKKINSMESTAETAAREFSEETSCLFYLMEKSDKDFKIKYNLLKNNKDLYYNDDTIKILKDLIIDSQKYYADKITEFVIPVYISSKETYISYFIRVEHIPEEDIPSAEDIHIPYETRYIRACRWFSIDEVMQMDEKEFHKRLQITRVQQRIWNYYGKGLFT